MARIGRNEPCPCGSGRKYKQCCLKAEHEAKLHDPQRWHLVDRDVMVDVLEWATRRLPGLSFEAFPTEAEDEGAAHALLSWGAFVHRHEGRPAAAHYLDRVRPLPADHRVWIEAQLASWPSIWQVREVDPGAALELEDVLTGARRRVVERTGSKTLAPWDTLLGRVVDVGGVSLLAGAHPLPLPPRSADLVVRDVRDDLALGPGPCAPDVLRTDAAMEVLISNWEEAADTLFGQPPPAISNTDGEPLVPSRDLFELEDEAQAEVLDRLAAHPLAEREGDVVHFLRPVDEERRTLVARARLTGGRLELETNSRQRAEHWRAEVERLAEGLVTWRAGEVQSIDKLLDGAPGPVPPLPPPLPEAAAMVRAYKARHYEQWLDEPLPALGGRTPHAAAKEPRLRGELELLLREMEHAEHRVPEDQRYDIGGLRKRLGL